MKLAVAAILTLGILAAGCHDVPTLTDAQLLWCDDDRSTVWSARLALGLKNEYQVWAESIGISLDAEGAISEQDDDLFQKEWEAQEEELGISGFYGVVWEAYLEHPDGIRACIAAYDLR